MSKMASCSPRPPDIVTERGEEEEVTDGGGGSGQTYAVTGQTAPRALVILPL